MTRIVSAESVEFRVEDHIRPNPRAALADGSNHSSRRFAVVNYLSAPNAFSAPGSLPLSSQISSLSDCSASAY